VNFFRQHDLPTRCARPFNNFGPGLKITDGRVLPDFARDVLAGRDIVMLSDGSADAHVLLRGRLRDRVLQGARRGHGGEGYNIGTETPEISMRTAGKVARSAATCSGTRARWSPAERGQGLPGRQPEPPVPGDREGPAHLGYEPEGEPDEGLRRTWSVYARTGRRKRSESGGRL
jgi:nucleoside-diphosphate-sugar epimerase